MSTLAGSSKRTDAATRTRPNFGGLVQRDSLVSRLSDASSGQVVLICAPAGSGKTVLLRSWPEAAGIQGRLAWVAVERGERDGQRFWLSVIESLADVVGDIQRVQPAPTFRAETVVDQLLEGLRSLAEPAVLVIDDLHELRAGDALAGLEVFLTRLPAGLGVVLATRADPQLGLHRLRLTGRLTEVRDPDLRFSVGETQDLLRAGGIELSERGVALLHERTEGWAAGLRLAAISLAQHPDPERFVTEFSGSERTVAGYLLAEVLEHQPPKVRELLLQTSVLGRVCGPLADYLTGGAGSERILLELEDANAFVTSLDVGRTWFRYHHLFADLLQLELRRTAPESVGPLNRAAAEWHEQHGDIVDAVRHAQAARDWRFASRLMADNYFDLTLDGRIGTVCDLLGRFPEDVAAADVELALVFATARLLQGELHASAAYLDLAERSAATVSTERRADFEMLLAELRLVLARWRGDLETVTATVPVVEAALSAQPPGGRALSDSLRSIALQNLGVAELWSSKLADARSHLEQGLEMARRAGRPWLEISPLGHLGVVGPWTGLPLSEGLRLSEMAVSLADDHGWPEDPIVITPLAAGATAMLWLGRFDEAEQWLERARAVLRPGGEPGTELLVHYALGLLHLAQGRLAEALSAFQAAQQMRSLLAGEHALALPVRARVMQTQARRGEPAAAHAALADVREEDRGFCDIRLAAATIHLAESHPESAIDALRAVIDGTAPVTHGPGVAIEAHLLDAVAQEQLGDRRSAEASLERALDLAEPEGIMLPFVLAPVHELLQAVPRHRTAHASLRRTILDVLSGAAPLPSRQVAALVDELSEAELRVVRYLPSNLRAPEIAAELFVSTNTIRTHLRHIYAKLGAHGRAEAVARARELGLLAPSARRQ